MGIDIFTETTKYCSLYRTLLVSPCQDGNISSSKITEVSWIKLPERLVSISVYSGIDRGVNGPLMYYGIIGSGIKKASRFSTKQIFHKVKHTNR